MICIDKTARMVAITKGDHLLAWAPETEVETLPGGVVLHAAREFRLSHIAATAHVDGAHMLDLFKACQVVEFDGVEPRALGLCNIVHAKFMLYETSEPVLRGCCFVLVPEGAQLPKLSALISSAANLIRRHGFEA